MKQLDLLGSAATLFMPDEPTNDLELVSWAAAAVAAPRPAPPAAPSYEYLYEQAPVAQCTLSPDGRVVQLNARACGLLGLSAEQLRGQSFLRLLEPARRLTFARRLSELLQAAGPASADETLLLPDGRSRRVRLEAVAGYGAAGEPVCHLALLDVTQAYLEAQALAASERKFRQLFEQSTDAAALMRNERFVDCNEATLALLGATRKDQIVGHFPWDLAPPEQQPGIRSDDYFRDSVAAALRQGSKRCQGILCRLTGEYMWAEAVLTPITDGGEALLHVVWRDVTAQKQQERLHLETEMRLRLLRQAARAGQWSWELTTNKLLTDAGTQACLGWTDSATPPSFEAFAAALHPDDAPAVLASLARAQDEGTWPEQHFRVLWPDGTVHRVTASGWVGHDAFGQPRRLLGIMLARPV